MNCYSLGSHILKRAELIFYANQQQSDSKIAKKVKVNRSSVYKWRKRLKDYFDKQWVPEWSIKEKVGALIKSLCGAKRSGCKDKYSSLTCCKVMTLALRKPQEFNRVISHWSLTELTDEVKKQGISETISRSTVGRILQNADVRPLKSRYWLNPKIEDEALFEKQIKAICKAYKETSLREDTVVYSVDEKTGIQALEFLYPSKNVLPGSPEKIEFEYKRHGTLCLIPSFNISTGVIDEFTISETRDEQDFADHIRKTINQKGLEP